MMANLWLQEASTSLALLIFTGALWNLPIVRGETCNSDLKIRPVVDISSSTENNSLPIGASITLTCAAEPRKIDSGYLDRWVNYIEWYDPQGRQVGATCQQPSDIHARKPTLSCLLVLKNLRVDNVGRYTCQAGNGYKRHCTRKSFEIRIQNEEKPQIVEDPKSQSASIGSNATFSCTAKGFPRPTVHWIKDNASYPLQSNSRANIIPEGPTNRSRLFISRVELGDYGKYQCIANNSIGRSQSGVAFLNKDFQKPEIVKGPKNQSVSMGSNATFSCIVKGFPRPTIHWIKDNASYPFESSPRASVIQDSDEICSLLLLTGVDKEDYGKYQCIANNSIGISQSGVAFLNKATTILIPVTERQLEDSASQIIIIAVSCVLIAALICVVIGFLWNRCRNRDDIHAQYIQTVAIRLRSLTDRQTGSRILHEHTGSWRV